MTRLSSAPPKKHSPTSFGSELEQESVASFVKALKEELGFEVSERANDPDALMGTSFVPDGIFRVRVGTHSLWVALEVKSEVRHLAQVRTFLEYARRFDGQAVVVATAIEPRIKDRLRSEGVGFYELGQTLSFPLALRLRERGPGPQPERTAALLKGMGFRAESSLKLLLYFVARPEALSHTQRQLHTELGISLGLVNRALASLGRAGLVQVRGGKRYLGNFENIVTRWRVALADFEYDKALIGRFSPVRDDFYTQWRQLDLIKVNAVWGGEPAAAIRTGYLTPGRFTVYTYDESAQAALRLMRLKRDPNGTVDVLKCFWPADLNGEDSTIPDFVTYCELLNSGIDRNIEAAKLLEGPLKARLKQYE